MRRKTSPSHDDAKGVLDAMEFLKSVNLGKKVNTGSKIGVIGGGNAAIDAARFALRLKNSKEVLIIYRRTILEMPAFKEEIDACLEEGIKIEFLTAPTKIIIKNRKLCGVECIKMHLGERDESGRRRPVPIKGSEFIIDLDSLIIAVGETTDTSFLGKDTKLEINKNGTIKTDPQTFATNIDGVFAGGDVTAGPGTVIDAMSAGKIAASMIDKYIKGEKLIRQYHITKPTVYVPVVELSEQEVEESAKSVKTQRLSLDKRVKNFDEVDLTYIKQQAIKEARRCLRCDLETQDAKMHFKNNSKDK